MTNLDVRIMKFMNRKEAEYPELKQPSSEIYKALVDANDGMDLEPQENKTYKKNAGGIFGRPLVSA